MLLRQQKRAKRREEHVFVIGERICFFLPGKKAFEYSWHMGDIVTAPVKTPDEKLVARVAILELEDQGLEVREIEEWETDAPPYFVFPAEVHILSRLLSQTKLPDLKKVVMADVDLGNACVARHTAFLDLLSPKRNWWDTQRR